MIESFFDEISRDIYHGTNSRFARKIPQDLHRIVCRKLDMVNSAESIKDLEVPPGNRLEKLLGQELLWSIRVNEKYRITFKWENGHAHNVRIWDYH